MGKANFSVALKQLRILNQDLNVTGAGLHSKIVDGQLVPEEEDDGEDVEEEV